MNQQQEIEKLYRTNNVNVESINQELEEFVDFGNVFSKVSLFDITVHEPKENKEDRNYDAKELMDSGSKLMDSSLYQQINNKRWVIFAQTPVDKTEIEPSLVGEALFYVYQYILTKGAVPPVETTEESIFIRDILKKPKTFHEYSKILASFDISLLDASWLKRVSLHSVPPLIKRRLTFGVLGHKVFEVFRLFKPAEIEDAHNKDCYRRVMKFTSYGPSWRVFFAMVALEYSTRLHEHVRNLLMLIHKIYSTTQIKKMYNLGLLDSTECPAVPRKGSADIKIDMYYSFYPIFLNSTLNPPPCGKDSTCLIFPLVFYNSLEKKSDNHDEKKAFISFDPSKSFCME